MISSKTVKPRCRVTVVAIPFNSSMASIIPINYAKVVYNRDMLLPRDRLLNLPIMSLQTGTQIGLAVRHIVDPRRLNIVAFYCEGPLIDFNPAILHTSDI